MSEHCAAIQHCTNGRAGRKSNARSNFFMLLPRELANVSCPWLQARKCMGGTS